MTPAWRPAVVLVLAAGGGGWAAPSWAQSDLPVRMVEFTHTQSALTDGYANGRAESMRLTWGFLGGHTMRGELIDEQRFGVHGGLAAVGYTRVLSPRWNVSADLSAGRGGPTWPQRRVDADVALAWGSAFSFVTRLGAYDASFAGGRSDRGLRVSASWYLPFGAVLEGGVVLNTSQPGSVRSQMPYVAGTVGTEGAYYLSARLASGSEAYQAVGDSGQIADFRSQTVSVSGRWWLAPLWGMTLQAEHYRNPSYQRSSVGAGFFYQW